MHDAARFEAAGLPALVVATDPFRPTVEATVDVIGLTRLRVLYVEHPVSRLTQDEIASVAAAVSPGVAAQLADAGH